jgi:hypothetical protein
MSRVMIWVMRAGVTMASSTSSAYVGPVLGPHLNR